MKSIIKKIIVTLLLILPINVFAKGNITVSPSSLTIEEGSTKTITITALNTIGDVSISSSNSGVASVSANAWETGAIGSGETKSGSINVTGVSAGSATITLTIDGVTFDEEDLSGQTRTVTVTVTAKQEPAPSKPSEDNNSSTPPSSNNNGNNNNTKTDEKPKEEKKSTNNKLKELTVDGYKLEKKDDNNYTLTVPVDTTSINIKATAEDSKAKVEGSGKHDIKNGENNIEVIVTSESGEQNKINIKVTRKDNYTIEDLESALEKNKNGDINITIDENTKISKQDVEKIKKSKKQVNLNYYDKDNKQLYSLILDGSKIKDTNEFTPTITFNSENKDKISNLSNYADGLFINVKEPNNLPKGTKIKLYVGDKYKDNDLVNVYGYKKNNDKLELVKDKLKVTKGYVEFEVGDYTDYLVTMSTLAETDNTTTTGKKTNLLPIILGIVGFLLLVGLIIFIIIKRKKKDNKKKYPSDNSVSSDFNNDMDSIIKTNDI